MLLPPGNVSLCTFVARYLCDCGLNSYVDQDESAIKQGAEDELFSILTMPLTGSPRIFAVAGRPKGGAFSLFFQLGYC